MTLSNTQSHQAVIALAGTPTYSYDLDRISHAITTLQHALPKSQLYYALKANANPDVLAHIATTTPRVGAEVISLGELEHAHRAGFSSIILGGPRQDLPLMKRALSLGVQLVSLDSLSQLHTWLQHYPQLTEGPAHLAPKLQFLLRLNPALNPKTHPHLATGAAHSKFGMTFYEVREAAEILHPCKRQAGIHVHIGSQIRHLDPYTTVFEQLAYLYDAFPSPLLDLGGGFAVPDFPLEHFSAQVQAFTSAYKLTLMLEPGRYIVADAGMLYAKVLHVKGRPSPTTPTSPHTRTHVITDAGMADLLRPALYGAQHPIRVFNPSATTETVDVDGPLCENADRLAEQISLPQTQAGDILCIEQVGAYGYSMSSNYAQSFRPAEVILQKGNVRLSRARETSRDLESRTMWQPRGMAALRPYLDYLQTNFSGVAAVALHNLVTEETLTLRAEQVMHAASLIKLPILITVLYHVQHDRYDLSQRWALSAEDHVSGSGTLQLMEMGLNPSLRDLLMLMIAVSDNSATNKLIDIASLEEVHRCCQRIGMHHTSLVGKLQLPPERWNNAQKRGERNRTCASDMTLLLTKLIRGHLLNPTLTRLALDMLMQQQYRDGISRYIPTDPELSPETYVHVASKSGAIRGVSHDSALVLTANHRPHFALTVMTTDSQDKRYSTDQEGLKLVADIGYAAWHALC